MDLEEMKNTWAEIGSKLEKQELLTNKLINKMTQEKYHSKVNKIGYSEYVGTIICYAGAAYLSINLAAIDDTLLKIFAIIEIIFLLVLPIISLQSIRALKAVNISSQTYLDAINAFVRQKIRFQKLQKLNVALGLFVLLISIPVLSAIQGKSLSDTPYFWTLIFPLYVLFFLSFSYWVLKSYNKILSDSEKMLSEINS